MVVCGVCAAAEAKYKYTCARAAEQLRKDVRQPNSDKQPPVGADLASGRLADDGGVDKSDDEDGQDAPPTLLVPNNDPVLSPEQLAKVRASETIRQMLGEPALQSLLVKIDSAQFPERMLDRELDREGLFRQFADEVLKVTGRHSQNPQ
nr:hypothetical protein HK105_000250 [Polyrhizophydium stewartii]